MNTYKNVIRLGKSWKQLLMDSLQNLHLLCIKFIKNNVSSQHQSCYLTAFTSERDIHLAVNMPFNQTGKLRMALVPAPSAAEIHESAAQSLLTPFLMQIQSYTWWYAFKTSISSKHPEATFRLHERVVFLQTKVSVNEVHVFTKSVNRGGWETEEHWEHCGSVETITYCEL